MPGYFHCSFRAFGTCRTEILRSQARIFDSVVQNEKGKKAQARAQRLIGLWE